MIPALTINPATKEAFHKLIDSVEHAPRLEAYYYLIKEVNTCENSELWNNLTDEQRDEILKGYEESFDDSNLIDHEVVMEGLEKWLKGKSNGTNDQSISLAESLSC